MTFAHIARFRILGVAAVCAALGNSAAAEPSHGIAMYGDPALPPDFVSLPYANPEAPKGGRIVFGESGSFDSLNPYIVTGQSPWGLPIHTVETLMARSIDEPFTLYGLLAESVDTDDARSYVEFTLRENARFSDGSPVTIEDVMWSMEKLGTEGAPRYATAWAKVAKMEATGPRSVRFTFTEADRELPLLMGLRPILKKAQWDGKDFTQSTLEAPIGSGPYTVDQVEPGRFITFKRNPDYWGKDLPVNQGTSNFDEIRYDYFGDAGVVFEAFKAGEISVWRETNSAKWEGQYDFPAVASGDVIKEEFPHKRPSGINGLVFNTRRDIFKDIHVRQALTEAFNFEFINTTLNGGKEPRICSYFCNSTLAMGDGPASATIKGMLEPFAADLPVDVMDAFALPVSDGSEANRAGIRKAAALLEEAGWTVQDGVLKNAAGEPFAFEILVASGAAETQSIIDIYVESLKRLGIAVTVTSVDSAQYKERTTGYDFDMTTYIRTMSLSPGNEQMLYWGSAGVTEPGTRNWMGMNSPAAEAIIKAMVGARTPEEFTVNVQALDRILTTGRYVIPFWYSDRSRIAYSSRLHHPERLPLYGDWPGFMPEVWWYAE
ncbi:MAG: extracellular solute-binding protein [Paracoccaceae bacterium]